MKSDKANLVQIKALLEEIQELDKLIITHQAAQDDLMSKQYEARKRKFFDELVSLLLATAPATEMPPSFYIGKLMQQFYPTSLARPSKPTALESILSPFVSI